MTDVPLLPGSRPCRLMIISRQPHTLTVGFSWCFLQLLVPGLNLQNTLQSRSKSHYGRRSVGQSVLVSSPFWGPRPDFYYCQPVTPRGRSPQVAHEGGHLVRCAGLPRHGPYRKHCLQQFLYCCVCISAVKETCLRSHFLAKALSSGSANCCHMFTASLHLFLFHNSGFQPSCHNIKTFKSEILLNNK
jgi:hypothetical protein